MAVKPYVAEQDGKLYYRFEFSLANTPKPKENVKEFVLQAIHALGVIQAYELLGYIKNLRQDSEIPIHVLPDTPTAPVEQKADENTAAEAKDASIEIPSVAPVNNGASGDARG